MITAKNVYIMRGSSSTTIIYPNESTMDYRFNLAFDVSDYYDGTVTLKLYFGKDQYSKTLIYSKKIDASYSPGVNQFESIAGWELYHYAGFTTIRDILNYAGITGSSCYVCMTLVY